MNFILIAVPASIASKSLSYSVEVKRFSEVISQVYLDTSAALQIPWSFELISDVSAVIVNVWLVAQA